MANPPFNVDMVDAERIKDDRRLPFGLPGVNKTKKVSNGNYLWISYFHSYLNKSGRAGFVMSSQASSAGHGEAEVRRKMIETGDVDVMIAIRSNFFYTRTVPCELWFFDKGKQSPDTVLMLDARNIYRKVTRKIYDFSPEHLANLTAIVWLYRGEQERFLGLIKNYFTSLCNEVGAVPGEISVFDATLGDIRKQLTEFSETVATVKAITTAQRQPLTDALTELVEAATAYDSDRTGLLADLTVYLSTCCANLPVDNTAQHEARRAFDSLAERIKGLIKQVDLLYKLAARSGQVAQELALDDTGKSYDRRAINKLLKQLDEERKQAVEQMKHAVYYHRQIHWLQERFPEAKMQAVPGLCKVVTRAEIEAADWSLTPGRYVGVAPAEVDDDFDFEQTLKDIHLELADLNREAVELAAKIQENFEELGV